MAIWTFDQKLRNSSLYAYAVHNNWPKTAQNDWRDIWRFQVAVHLQLPRFLVIYIYTTY